MKMKNRRVFAILTAIVLLLLIPLIAMQFTNEVIWTFPDFMIMGILLLGVGLTIEFTLRTVKSIRYRSVFIFVLLAGFLLIWTELAVGIFGSPLSGD